MNIVMFVGGGGGGSGCDHKSSTVIIILNSEVSKQTVFAYQNKHTS